MKSLELSFTAMRELQLKRLKPKSLLSILISLTLSVNTQAFIKGKFIIDCNKAVCKLLTIDVFLIMMLMISEARITPHPQFFCLFCSCLFKQVPKKNILGIA